MADSPQHQTVEIYRTDQAVEVISFPVTLAGEDVLPGFTLEINEAVWPVAHFLEEQV